MDPTAVHECLDERGDLDASRESGVYALAVPVPDTVEAVQRDWMNAGRDPLPDAYAARLADAVSVAYVGSSTGSVYDRIMDHAEGEVRQAALLSVFGFGDVVGVWPAERPRRAERKRARALADGSVATWTDGEVF